jgi:hypothetical protein
VRVVGSHLEVGAAPRLPPLEPARLFLAFGPHHQKAEGLFSDLGCLPSTPLHLAQLWLSPCHLPSVRQVECSPMLIWGSTLDSRVRLTGWWCPHKANSVTIQYTSTPGEAFCLFVPSQFHSLWRYASFSCLGHFSTVHLHCLAFVDLCLSQSKVNDMTSLLQAGQCARGSGLPCCDKHCKDCSKTGTWAASLSTQQADPETGF